MFELTIIIGKLKLETGIDKFNYFLNFFYRLHPITIIKIEIILKLFHFYRLRYLTNVLKSYILFRSISV